jgi:hypothetical protein
MTAYGGIYLCKQKAVLVPHLILVAQKSNGPHYRVVARPHPSSSACSSLRHLLLLLLASRLLQPRLPPVIEVAPSPPHRVATHHRTPLASSSSMFSPTVASDSTEP